MGLKEELIADCGFDYESTLDRFMGQDDLVDEFMQIFIQSEKKEMDEFAVNMESKDTSQIRHSAHSLKGAARNMGLNNIGNLCSALQWVCDGKPESYGDRPTVESIVSDLGCSESGDEITALYEEILREYDKAEHIIHKYLG